MFIDHKDIRHFIQAKLAKLQKIADYGLAITINNSIVSSW